MCKKDYVNNGICMKYGKQAAYEAFQYGFDRKFNLSENDRKELLEPNMVDYMRILWKINYMLYEEPKIEMGQGKGYKKLIKKIVDFLGDKSKCIYSSYWEDEASDARGSRKKLIDRSLKIWKPYIAKKELKTKQFPEIMMELALLINFINQYIRVNGYLDNNNNPIRWERINNKGKLINAYDESFEIYAKFLNDDRGRYNKYADVAWFLFEQKFHFFFLVQSQKNKINQDDKWLLMGSQLPFPNSFSIVQASSKMLEKAFKEEINKNSRFLMNSDEYRLRQMIMHQRNKEREYSKEEIKEYELQEKENEKKQKELERNILERMRAYKRNKQIKCIYEVQRFIADIILDEQNSFFNIDYVNSDNTLISSYVLSKIRIEKTEDDSFLRMWKEIKKVEKKKGPFRKYSYEDEREQENLLKSIVKETHNSNV